MIPDVVRKNVSAERVGDDHEWHRPAGQRLTIQRTYCISYAFMDTSIADGLFAAASFTRRQLPVTGGITQCMQQKCSNGSGIEISALIGRFQVGILRRAQNVIPINRLLRHHFGVMTMRMQLG